MNKTLQSLPVSLALILGLGLARSCCRRRPTRSTTCQRPTRPT